jgi:histidinol-phosphate phosphatase family protein
MTALRKAVFFDLDGALVAHVPADLGPASMRLTDGAGPALRALHEEGFEIVVLSDQSAVAHGLTTEEALVPVRRRLEELLTDEGVGLVDFLYCPHHPQGVRRGYAIDCLCRRPRPGLLRRAAAEHGLDLGRSWLVGGTLDDIEAGVRAGCRTILLDGGAETEWRMNELRLPHHVVMDLDEAVRLIGEDDRAGARPRGDRAATAPRQAAHARPA